MKSLSIVKRLAVAAVAAAALAGPVTAAHALQFSAGDAVLAVYGNGTEYVKNLGTISNLIANGVDVDLNLGGVLTAIGPTSSLKYTVFGFTGSGATSTMFFGDSADISLWTNPQKSANLPANLSNVLINYSNNLAAPPATSGNLFLNTDPLSFTKSVNPTGSDTLFGSVSPVHPAVASIDTVLNLLQRTGGATTLAQVGTGFLSSANGHFVVSAVPVPAAVVLFATGVIGLVGLARRKMSGARPEAA